LTPTTDRQAKLMARIFTAPSGWLVECQKRVRHDC